MLLSLFILPLCDSYSQLNPALKDSKAFISFLDGERSQKMVHCVIDGALEINYVKTGSEVINNIEYIRFDGDYSGFPPSSLFLREDTISGKLWVYDEIEEHEWLAIDMGMELNDTLLLSPRYAAYYDTIAIVDSVFYDNEGRRHLRFNISCYNFALSPAYNKLEFIEGIGTNFGLGYQVINPIEDLYQEILLCAFIDNEKTYSHNSTSGNSCRLIIDGVGIVNIEHYELKVYPNPAKDYASFDFTLPNDETSAILVITNPEGRVIETISVNGNQGQQLWDTKAVPAGTYIYTIKVAGFSKSGKLMIVK